MLDETDYDVEAFEDGRATGYRQGRIEADRLAVLRVAGILQAAGGRVEVPDILTETAGRSVRTWRDENRRVTVWEVAP